MFRTVKTATIAVALPAGELTFTAVPAVAVTDILRFIRLLSLRCVKRPRAHPVVAQWVLAGTH